MGGKSSKSTSTTTIPADVLNRYNAVNDYAQQVAQTPFQQYSTDPNAFVAPLNSTQTGAISSITAHANQAQPYYTQATSALNNAQSSAQPYYTNAGNNITSGLNTGQAYNAAATGLAQQGGLAVNPSDLNSDAINKYLSPYLGTVLNSTSALLNQNNQQQQAGQLGTAITSGAFGGDRAGIAAANLAQQQNLSNANIYSNILNQGYSNALTTAEGQQQLGLGAAQANRTAVQSEADRIAGIGNQAYTQALGAGQAQQGLGQTVYNTGASTSQGLANIGNSAQSSALQGAQAQLAAGTVAQQTQQAGQTALYNQFLQQQAYPFQTAQFLANIAEGTGSLSGSTTTTTQPGGFFSDERLKENIEEIGKTFDKQPIYSYNYKGDERKQIGLLAQEVEKLHPEAVGLAGGYKTVDYGKATHDAAKRGHFYEGGVVVPGYDPALMASILQNQQASYGGLNPSLNLQGGGGSRVPQANLPVHGLNAPTPVPQGPSGLEQLKSAADMGSSITDLVSKIRGGKSANDNADNDNLNGFDPSAGDPSIAYQRGGLVGYANGGMPYSDLGPLLNIPNEPNEHKLVTPQQPQQQSGGGLGDIVKTAAAIIPFLATGGRAQRAEGGRTEEVVEEDPGERSDFGRDLIENLLKTGLEEPEENVVSSDEAPEQEASEASPYEAVEEEPMEPLKPNAPAKEKGDIGPRIRNSGKGTRADRNNNPGNIEAGKFAAKQPGYKGTDGRFAVFDTPENGKKAQQALLRSYVAKGIDTPMEIANRWAPGSEKGNNPITYAKSLAAGAGIGVHDPVPAGGLGGLAMAQARHEGWTKRASGGRTGYDAGGTILEVDPTEEMKKIALADAAAKSQKVHDDFNAGFAPEAAQKALSDLPTNTPGLAPPVAPVVAESAPPQGLAAAPAPPMAAAPQPNMASEFGEQTRDQSFGSGLKHGKASSILPILAGLAAMGTAPTRSLGVALAAGLGAGVNAYQGQRQYEVDKALEQQKLSGQQQGIGLRGQEVQIAQQMLPYQTGLLGAQTGQVGAETAAIRAKTPAEVLSLLAAAKLQGAQALVSTASALHLTPVPDGRGGADFIGYDAITRAPVRITAGEITSASTPAVTEGTAPTTTPAAKPTATPSPTTKPTGTWQPVTGVPENYNFPYKGAYLLPGHEAQKQTDYATVTRERDAAQKADARLVDLREMEQQAQNLGGGWTSQGVGGSWRNKALGTINSYLSVVGGQPINPNAVAGAESLSKFTNLLGINLSRSLGQGEAASVVNMAIGSNPGIENTPMGFKRLVSSLAQTAQYEKDRAAFYQDYFGKFQSLQGAQQLFDKLNPPQNYARRAIMNTAAPEDVAALKKNPAKYKQAFDKQYGIGVSSYFLGR